MPAAVTSIESYLKPKRGFQSAKDRATIFAWIAMNPLCSRTEIHKANASVKHGLYSYREIHKAMIDTLIEQEGKI